MRLKTLFVVVIILLCGASVFAQSQSELNQQAEDGYRKADAELNRVYKALSSGLDPASRSKLTKSEQAWIKFRDADAEAKAEENRGGSIQPLVYFGWMTRLTQARTSVLRIWLDESRNR